MKPNPCQCCGNQTIHYVPNSIDKDGSNCLQLICMECHCCTIKGFQTLEEAVEFWNERNPVKETGAFADAFSLEWKRMQDERIKRWEMYK